MDISPIHTEADYRSAVDRIRKIFDSTTGSTTGNELEIPVIHTENFEKEYFSICFPDPIEAIKLRMEQLGMKQKDMAESIGFKSRLGEIRSKNRKFTSEIIRKWSAILEIPTDVLVQYY